MDFEIYQLIKSLSNNVRLTSSLPMVSPVLSRGKIQVSTWNEKAARRLSARATHTKRESTLVFCAPYDVLATWPRVKQILDILFVLSNPRLASPLLRLVLGWSPTAARRIPRRATYRGRCPIPPFTIRLPTPTATTRSHIL
jgi:hypothetical protein